MTGITHLTISLDFFTMGGVMIVFGSMSVFFMRQQFLISLLGMEVVTLSIFLLLTLTLSQMKLSISISFFVLVMAACEASLGLSLLVIMTRNAGSDMYYTLMSTLC